MQKDVKVLRIVTFAYEYCQYITSNLKMKMVVGNTGIECEKLTKRHRTFLNTFARVSYQIYSISSNTMK